MENELDKRKSPRLKDFDYAEIGAYFITICCKDMLCLLGEVVEKSKLQLPAVELSEIGKIVDKNINLISGVDKYVIMPNHIHMVIFLGCKAQDAINHNIVDKYAFDPIPNILRYFKTNVTKDVGFSIFQRSFHDHIIRNDTDLHRIFTYIENNPVNWEKDCFHF